jgi:hypothetical protein
MLLAAIGACEVAVWVFPIAGLATSSLLHRLVGRVAVAWGIVQPAARPRRARRRRRTLPPARGLHRRPHRHAPDLVADRPGAALVAADGAGRAADHAPHHPVPHTGRATLDPGGATMTTEQSHDTTTTSPWAPWWGYEVVLVVAASAVLFGVVTARHRGLTRRGRRLGARS